MEVEVEAVNVYEMKLVQRVLSAWLSEQSEFTDASFTTAQHTSMLGNRSGAAQVAIIGGFRS